MSIRVLSVVSMFIVSTIIGYNLLSPTVIVQAAPPVVPSVIELPSFAKTLTKERKSVNEIDVSVDLSTMEVSVKGATDAIVNVKTIGEPTPVIKWKTKVKEVKTTNGYPYVKSIGQMPDSIKPVSPITVIK